MSVINATYITDENITFGELMSYCTNMRIRETQLGHMYYAVSLLLFYFVCFHRELYLSCGTTSGTCSNSTANHKTSL